MDDGGQSNPTKLDVSPDDELGGGGRIPAVRREACRTGM